MSDPGHHKRLRHRNCYAGIGPLLIEFCLLVVRGIRNFNEVVVIPQLLDVLDCGLECLYTITDEEVHHSKDQADQRDDITCESEAEHFF